MSSPIQIKPYLAVAKWDDFVQQHPQGHIYHTSAMIRTFADAKGCQPLAIAAVDANGSIHAILVAVRVLTLGAWAGSFAARSICFAEPISHPTPTGRAGLDQLIQYHDSVMRRRTLFAEVRPIYDSDPDSDPLLHNGYQHLGYLNYESDLTIGEAELWKLLDSKCRNNVRTSWKRGVTVREADSLDELPLSYPILQFSYANSKTPLTDISLFESVARQLGPEYIRLLVAEYEGQAVACGWFLTFRRRVTYWYGGAYRISGIYAMSCLLWEAMKDAANNGSTCFDFAGAGWEGEDYGPGRFKSKFGGQLTNFGRYRKVYAAWKMRCAEQGYSMLRGVLAPRK